MKFIQKLFRQNHDCTLEGLVNTARRGESGQEYSVHSINNAPVDAKRVRRVHSGNERVTHKLLEDHQVVVVINSWVIFE